MSNDLAKPTAAEIVKSQRQQENMTVLQGVTDLDWRKLPPPMLAQLIMGLKGLPPLEAAAMAIRCYELGISPLSNECWWNPQSKTLNLSFEGKKRVARNQGYQFTTFKEEKRETRPWPKGKPKLLGIEEDIGITASVSVWVNGEKEKSTYTAWLSGWFKTSSPMWKDNPDHMLYLRACEKALSFATGVGASEMPGDDDIKASKLETEDVEVPVIEVKEVTQ